MADSAGRFRRSDRLLRTADFRAVTKGGRRVVGRAFVMVVFPRGEDDGPRIGITVSRRVGNAVVRNRVKRRVREWFRQNRFKLQSATDLVVIARSRSATVPTREVGRMLCGLALSAGIVR